MEIPRSLRALLRLSLAVAVLHIAFGAIVRISGSGMGCGDHWPKCLGAWFPPMDQPTLVIEWTHRLLAAILVTTVSATALVAWRARGMKGVGGRGGVLRPALLALALVFTTALFGAVTVWLQNAPLATVGHWSLAAALLATLATALVRAGDLGGARWSVGTAKLARGAAAAAGLAFVVLILGGLTAKVPGANAACSGIPLCGTPTDPNAPGLATLQLVQMFHRVLAYLLFFHLMGLAISTRRITEAPAAVRAVRIAFALALLQVGIAFSMVLRHLPGVLRSAHQITGVLLWLAVVVATLLARRAAPAEAPVPPSVAVLIARGGGA
ncbi:MAG TPA: COX15/CtaA family protein [Gemmatimonadaceae bacterium]|nr:COX15/CtaA family protein [Gemmatimonadaceae bacterium]